MHDEFDLLIAVTAIENKLTLVTYNVKDFVNMEKLKIGLNKYKTKSKSVKSALLKFRS